MAFDAISLTGEVFFINPYANVFVFGDFNIHHKDWLTYSGATGRSGELCYKFSNDLTQMVNFLTQSQTHSHILTFWSYFFLLALVFVLQ